jgi:acyl-coenzyme A thioesterase 9
MLNYARAIGFRAIRSTRSSINKPVSRSASGLSLDAEVDRPSSLKELGNDPNNWVQELPFTYSVVDMHAEYFGLVPSCSPMEPLNEEGKRSRNSSFTEIRLPFSDDKLKIKEQMVNYAGKTIRYGKLFEIIDMLAGDVAGRHCHGCDESITIVTASVDGMNVTNEDILVDKDLILQGYITYAGRSSMEIHVNLLSDDKLVACTQFIMVARHGADGAAFHIPGLALNNQKQIDEYERGGIRASERKIQAKSSLAVMAPEREEVESMHALYLRSKGLKAQKRALLMNKDAEHYDDSIVKNNIGNIDDTGAFKYMKHTRVSSTEIMHPQNRNVHGKIFGGEIMRKAFELGYITAICFIGREDTQFVAVDDINFIKPVNIGSIMLFSGCVTYATKNEIVVVVKVEEVEAETMERIKTNQLSYVFKSRQGTTKSLPSVIPRDYGEFVRYLEGKRTWTEIRDDYTSKN